MFYVESITINRSSWFARIWQGFKNFCEVAGYARAASHLASLGYYEEAQHCMMEVAKLKK